MKKITLLATVMCCFVLASCGGGGKGGNSPSEMVIEFYNLAKADDGDITRAMAYIMENTDYSGVSEEQAAKVKEQMNQLATGLSEKMKAEVAKHEGLNHCEITEETISEDGLTAIVKSYSVYNDGTNGDEGEMNFVKVDGKWKFKNNK